MKRILIYTSLTLVLILGIISPSALSQRRGSHCREEYNQAVRRINRERGRDRRARLERARREYNDCMRRERGGRR